MNEEPQLMVTLSREELLAVLAALRAPAIPGLDPEPSGDLTPKLTDFAIVIARRALLARGLAQVRDDGGLLLQRGLLQAVGACAYPERSIVVHTWPADGEEPDRLFGHVRGADIIGHTRPDLVLHRFARLPSVAALAAHALDVCAFDAPPPAAKLDITLPQADFSAVRSQASGGDVQGAKATLVGCGASEAAAAALAETWAGKPRVSVVQMLTAQGGGSGRVREFTLTQARTNGYVAGPLGGDVAAGAIRMRSTSRQEMEALLTGG